MSDAVQEVIDALPMTVQEHLAAVDYSIDPNYVPSDFALRFVAFIKMVNGEEGEENTTPTVHYHMLDKVTHGGSRVANLCHRGMAKTTVLGEYLFLYCAVYGELPVIGAVNLAIYVSDSIDNGVKNMRKNLEYRYDNSDFLKEYVPAVKFTDVRWEFTNIDGLNFLVKGYGAKTGVRGAKEYGVRPQLAVMDDLISDEDARSPTIIAAVEDTVHKAINHALHPSKNMVIWSGTPFNQKDPLYKAVESGAWSVNVFPVCEKFPCSKEEFRGSWPDRFPYEYVKHQYELALKQGKIADFNQELMLQIMSDEDRVIQDGEINWYSRKTLLQNRHLYNFYVTTDFATSEREHADFSAISVWALNAPGFWFWVDGILRRQLMDKNIDDLFRLCQMYKPKQVGVEVSGQQGGFIPWIQKEMMQRSVFFPLASEGNKGAPGIRPATNTKKLERFFVVEPWFKAGMMFFPEEMRDTDIMREAVNEITLVSPKGFRSKHDDFLDTITMLSKLNTFRPSAQDVDFGENGIWSDNDFEDDYADGIDSYLV